MKLCIAVVALAIVVYSGPVPEGVGTEDEDGSNMKYFLVETSPGVYEVEDLEDSEVDSRSSETDITYHFFSVHNPTNGRELKIGGVDDLKNTEFQASKETLFVIHGWKDDNDSTYNTQMREAVLSTHDINLFIVDWSPISSRTYVTAKTSVVTVGNYLASFVQALVTKYRLDLSKVTFIGHSLGAHVAGNAGATLKGKVARIVGLDPAGPLFSVSKINERLDKTDAQFVHIIHTNGGTLGFKHPSGHSDYYPNGGESQPGCILDIAGACAHSRSFIYYAESILSGQNAFKAMKCSNYRTFSRGQCSSNDFSIMAGYDIDTHVTGTFYLKTNSKPPYAQG